ncbi:MAG: NapC/NirT family cytochrome c [Actinobacteria bacterium]|nr:NapC/NirT family cytochrome c [Actinomycetota bacterium]
MRRLPLIAGVVLVVIGVLTVVGFDYTSKPSFCSSCHAIAPYAKAWETSSHKEAGVTCIDCHFEPGAVGYLKGKVYSLIKLTQWAVGETDRKPEAAKTIVAGACRECHADVKATFIPHAFHTEVANLQCTECHSAIVHGAALVGEEKPQAAADPAFCSKCHTGDIAPILFGPIEPVGRVHPGAPKIDVNVWRNIHWRMADAPAVIDGKPYDKIEKDTCLACHKEPTVAKACKGCHFARVPVFRVSTAAEKASGLPLAIAALMFVLLMLTVFLKSKNKAALFSSRLMQAVVGLVALSDLVVVYLIVRDTLVKETGSVEIGPTTVWITYLLVSIAIVLLVLYESVIKPGHERLVLLPPTDEEEIYVPDHNVWLKQPEASTFVEGDEPDPLYRYGARPSPPEDQHD